MPRAYIYIYSICGIDQSPTIQYITEEIVGRIKAIWSVGISNVLRTWASGSVGQKSTESENDGSLVLLNNLQEDRGWRRDGINEQLIIMLP